MATPLAHPEDCFSKTRGDMNLSIYDYNSIPMSDAEKIALASCLLLAVFLVPIGMLLPLLRGRSARDKRSPGSEWTVLHNLVRPPRSRDARSMEELARQVEGLRRVSQPGASPLPSSQEGLPQEGGPPAAVDDGPEHAGNS